MSPSPLLPTALRSSFARGGLAPGVRRRHQLLRAAFSCALVVSASAGSSSGSGQRLIISDIECIGISDSDASGRHTLVIEDERITAILSPDVDVFVPGDLLIRGTGLFLMAGLIDASVGRVDPSDLQLMAVDGVTSAAIDDPAQLVHLAPVAQNAALPIPRLLPPGETLARTRLGRAESGRRFASGAIREDSVSRLIPQRTLDRWNAMVPADPDALANWLTEADQHLADWSKQLCDEGAFLVGSSAGDPFVPVQWALQRELEALAGLRNDEGEPCFSVADLLIAVTRGNADALGQPSLARLAPGAPADLLLLEADPRIDLGALRQVRGVVLRGRYLYRSARETIVRAVEDAVRWSPRSFAIAPAWSDWVLPEFRSESVVEFDGLPRGAERTVVRRFADEFESVWQQELWPPISRLTSIDARHDREGRLLSATLTVVSPREVLLTRIDRNGATNSWRIESTRDAETVSREVPSPEVEGSTILLGLLPLAVEIHASLQTGAPIRGQELVYGEGPVELRPLSLEVVMADLRTLPGLAGALVPGAVGADSRIAVLRESRAGSIRAWCVLDQEGWPIRSLIPVPDGLWEVHIDRANAAGRE